MNRTPSRRRLSHTLAQQSPRALLMALALASAACSEEVTGPAPALSSDAAALPVDPAVICADQLTTDVVLRGSNFSPIAIDVAEDPKAALPSLKLSRAKSLDGAAAELVDTLFSGDPTNPVNVSLLAWDSPEQMTFTVNQELELADGTLGKLPTGIHDIGVVNPNTQETQAAGALAVVARPELGGVSPGIVCLAEASRTVNVSGVGMLELDGAQPTVSFASGEALPVSNLSDCTNLAHDGVQGRLCTSGEVTLSQDQLEAGYHAAQLTNPSPAACWTEEQIDLRVVPPPVIDRVTPILACVAQEDRTFVLEGSGFLEIDGALPSVTIGGVEMAVSSPADCEELPTMGHTARSCSSVTVTVAQSAVAPGAQELVLNNPEPAGCSATASAPVRIVPPPMVDDVQPALVCVEDGSRVVDVLGEDFLVVDGVVPEVLFGEIAPESVTAEDCEAIEADGMEVSSCTRLVATLGAGALEAGLHNVSVANPDPAGCSATGEELLAVVDGPTIESATPSLLCVEDGSRELVLAGTNFVKVGSTFPTVTLGSTAVTVTSAAGCEPVETNGLAAESCTSLTATVPQGALSEGDIVVTVENPVPAGCQAQDSEVLTVPPALAITQAAPSNVCTQTGTHEIIVTATGLLRVGGEDFTVTLNGNAVTPSSIDGCTALNVDGLTVQSCTSFTVSVDANSVPVGDVAIAVTNPEPSGCGETSSAVFRIAGPPTVTSVVPDNVCSEVATTLTITGDGFADGAKVFADTSTTEPVEAAVEFVSATELKATFANGMSAGSNTIIVENGAGAGCTATVAAAVEVDPTPIVFFVDPPVLYSEISVEGTIYTSGLSATAQTVELVDEGGNITNITDFSSPDKPNRILAQFPDGLVAGQYEVRVTSDLGCVGGLSGGIKVTDDLLIDLEAINPGYVTNNDSTAVSIEAKDPPGEGLVGFTSTPRAYLNPMDVLGSATALRAVVYKDASELSAVVPDNLAPGTYQLIVVNPTGEVGVLDDALEVTDGDPPYIDAVTPSSLDNSSDQLVTVAGTNFDPVSVSVNFICKDALTNVESTEAAVPDLTTLTTTSVEVTVPTAGKTANSICLVELLNSDGAGYVYSAVSIKNPAQNLRAWSTGANLNEGRRALSLVAARPTSASRFLHAIGGDSGTVAGAKSSTELVSVGRFGEMGTWTVQGNSLPSARTQAGVATVGNFVYLTGGHDGAAATSTVYRSEVLDPLVGPEIDDLDAMLGDGEKGLGGGRWIYRLAATYPSSNTNNPGGESLPGEPLNVELPERDSKIILTLKWLDAAGANGYRLYRSPVANEGADSLELLSEISCGADTLCQCGVNVDCSFTDEGGPTDPSLSPLVEGSLGVWHAAPGSGGTLTTAREGHATVAIENPAAANEYYLYAFGGRDAGGTYLSSYEWARVTVENGGQTVSGWTLGTKSIGTAKAHLSAWVVTSADSAAIASDEVFIFVGTGQTSGAISGEVRSGFVDSGSTTGDLLTLGVGTSLDSETGISGGARATAGLTGGGSLLLLGGRGNAALLASDSSSGLISGPGLDNWNSLGSGSLVTRRAYAGAAQESSFLFVAGGETTGTDAITSVETTLR